MERQIALAREVFRAGVPFFGSCWGVQMAAVAAGGDVRRNPLGRELAFARNIAPTEAGRMHPLLAGRPAAFDAPAIHLDVVSTPPPGCTILAANALAPAPEFFVPALAMRAAAQPHPASPPALTSRPSVH